MVKDSGNGVHLDAGEVEGVYGGYASKEALKQMLPSIEKVGGGGWLGREW